MGEDVDVCMSVDGEVGASVTRLESPVLRESGGASTAAEGMNTVGFPNIVGKVYSAG